MLLTGSGTYLELEEFLTAHENPTEDERARLLLALAALRDTAERHELLTAALDQLPDEIFLKDCENRYVIANRQAEFAVGAAPGAMAGKDDDAFFTPEVAARYRGEDELILATGKPIYHAPYRCPLPQGDMRWNQITKYPVVDRGGAIVGICGQVRQSTEMMQSRMLLEAQIGVLEMLAACRPVDEVLAKIVALIEEQLQDFFGSIVVLDGSGTFFSHVIAPAMPEEYGQALVGIAIADDVGTCGTACYRGEPVFTEDILTDPNWEPFRALAAPFGLRSCWSVPYFNADGTVHGSFGLYSRQPRLPSAFEIQCLALGSRLAELALERERSAAQIRLMAERDSLTGLPNRAAFAEIFARELSEADAVGQEVAVAIVDVDDFKQVNDRYGHAIGDRFLTTFSQLIVGAAGQGNLVARLGGDEFAIVFRPSPDVDFVRALGDLAASLHTHIDIDRHRLLTAVSAGLAVFPQHGSDAGTLLNHADAAMHKAKQQGGNRIDVYDPEFSKAREFYRRKIEQLRVSIANGDIDLDFQPLVSVRDACVVGFEALARWQHPQEGRLGPGAFIPLAEKEGLIVELGGAVLMRACCEAAGWRRQFGVSHSVSVNVSAQQFAEGRILEQVRAALNASGLDPVLLELELTESMLLEDEEQAIRIMSELKGIGISFAIDDFGTGFSNLGALARLPVDRLKIDRSIIRDIEANVAAASIASAIIVMGQRLGLTVLAEGVETAGQMEFLRSNACDHLQGYLLARPIPSADLRSLLAGGSEVADVSGLRIAAPVREALRVKIGRRR
jgi:diguanylate cyclase (GGDEF)-like protein/PAS domain S-box-containing protein